MTDLPLVSICAANYNNQLYVLETLESIKSQTYKNIELIIIDDCSTDKSPGMIEEWLQKFDRPYKFIKHEKNKGVCKVCNNLLNSSSGRYISLIATDDIMLPEKIERQVNILEGAADNIGAVYSDALLIDDSGKLIDGMFVERYLHSPILPSGYIFEELLNKNFIPGMSMLVRKCCYDAAGPFDEELVFEDYDMWLRIFEKWQIFFSDYVSVKYRIRQNSLMSVTRNWDPSIIKILRKHMKGRPEIVQKLEDFGVGSYCNKDAESIKSLLPVSKLSFKVRIATYLHYLKIPQSLGLYILKRL